MDFVFVSKILYRCVLYGCHDIPGVLVAFKIGMVRADSERVKKHSMNVKPRKERVKDRVEVLKAFFCAFSALPANSPSTPNNRARIREFFLRFSCNSPVFLMASSGVSLLSFLAGSHAEINTVRADTRMVIQIREDGK